MNAASKGFFDYHIESLRQVEPMLSCPVRLGSRVLQNMGVTLPAPEFHEFIEDLKDNNIHSEVEKEEI